MSVAPRVDPAIPVDLNSAFPEAHDTPPNRQDYQPGRRFGPLRWRQISGHNIERQILIVQWALPLVLFGIVLVYEVAEHFLAKRETFPSPDFLGEVFFFGILGPIAVWLVLRWIRSEWLQREHDKQALQRMYRDLAEAQKRLNTLHTQRGELLNRLMSIQEEERRRLAREIHDELGQLLTGLSLNLKLCQDAIPDDFEGAHDRLSRATTLVRHTIEQAHYWIADLRPTALDDYGLMPALQEELHQRLSPLNIAIHLDAGEDMEQLPPPVATTAFRIVQEAVTNVIRHANAGEVRVQLQFTGEGLMASVEDDGVGMRETINGATDNQALGILGMQERASALGGSLQVASIEPNGTRIQFYLPAQKGQP
ncbi:MAG: sensor histidine kinase [Anaerolineae bacterium]